MKSRGRSPASTGGGSSVAAAPPASSSVQATPPPSSSTSLMVTYQPTAAAPPQRGGAKPAADKQLLAASSGLANRQPSEAGSDYVLSDPGGGGGGGTASSSPMHRNNSLLLATAADGSSQLTPGAASALADSSADYSGLGNSIFYDDPDLDGSYGQHGADPELTHKAMEQLQSKIDRTKDLIKVEQTTRDDNVNEYLKLSSNADRQQVARIKQVFEKKNQKSAQNIAHYGKKLEEYQRRLLNLQEHGLRPKQSHKLGKDLKKVGGNIRDGITGMSSSVMSKPKEFAHLIRHKFGSADNLAALAGEVDKKDHNHHGSASLPRENSGGGLSGAGAAGSGSGMMRGGSSSGGGRASFAGQSNSKRKCISEDGGRSRSDRSESMATSSEAEPRAEEGSSGHLLQSGVMSPEEDDDELTQQQQQHGRRHHMSGAAAASSAEWKAVMQELVLHREEVEHLREEMEEQRQQFKSEIEALTYQLREERDRCERLEEQMNDLTELHQHEIENIKSGVGDMEEKVQYQSEERLLDIKETLQSLETKVTSIEHQQTQQQYLNIEGLDNTDARAVMMKLLTAAITFVHVVLFVVGALMGVARPFLRTTPRAAATVCLVCLVFYARHQQDTLVAIYRRLRPQGFEDENSEL